MNENENLVTDEVTENVEQTTEETPEKKYTEAEFNERVNEKVREVTGRRIARKEAQIRKEYESKYGRLEEVLKAGTGKESVDEMTDTFADFYEKKGIKINKAPEYSAKDIETLARAEANEIISAGFEDVVDEVDRLTEKGVANMNAREKAMFKVLAEYRQQTELTNEFEKLGVPADEYNSPEFKEYAKMFRSDIPMTRVYEEYTKTKPKKEIRTAGSMKNSDSADSGIKDFYTPEEARRFTKSDFDKNPALFKAVEKSMLKW